jgi:hypothetical protein
MICRLSIAILPAILLCTQAPAGEPAPAGGQPLLAETSCWRVFQMAKTPQVRKGAGLEEARDGWGYDACVANTPPPPEGWTAPDFQDSAWSRWSGPGRRAPEFEFGYQVFGASGPTLALICLRGRFMVESPAAANGLKLSLAYRGGVVVYVNGKELARGHLTKEGALKPEALAEDYPPEAFVKADGKPLRAEFGEPKGNPDRMQKRIRRLEGMTIPAEMLRKGTNVLAVELHRAPYSGPGLEMEGLGNRSVWSTCGLISLDLRAAGGATGSISRPAGIQVWVPSAIRRSSPWDWADPLDGPQTLAISGCRNGAFDGKVLVSSGTALKGVKATTGELKHRDGQAAIPAAQVRVFYAVRDDKQLMRYRVGGGFWDALLDEPPAEVPAEGGGAVQPIVLKVQVGADAAPGDYEGKVTVSADGIAPAEVPVRLHVADWKLPDVRNHATLMGLVQSPDSVALHYKVPPWSEEHWKLMEKTFEFLGEIGNGYVCVPLLCRANFGNEQSMVRWVRKEVSGVSVQVSGNEKKDGVAAPDTRNLTPDTYSYDFAVFDRYMDLAQKHLNLRVVFFYSWERSMDNSQWAGKGDHPGKGGKVTLLASDTGKTEVLETPRLVTPEGKAAWGALWKELLARMDKRGLRAAAMMGTNGDGWGPTQEMMNVWKEIAPGVKWISSAHADVRGAYKGMAVGYNTRVYNSLFPAPGAADRRAFKDGRCYGWQTMTDLFPREGCTPTLHPVATLAQHRTFIEAAFLSDNAGLGRTGADFWSVLGKESTDHSKRVGGYWNEKRSTTVTARYADEPGWDQLNMDTCTEALLSPGPKGAVATERFEQLRQSVQEGEARAFIEKAVLSGKLDAETVKKCWAVLDERQWQIRAALTLWDWSHYEGAGSEGLAAKLFACAGEVAAKLGGK